MDSELDSSSRRSFFLKGGAALGAGIATGTGASVVLSRASPPQGEVPDLQAQLATARDREAVRGVHLAYTRMMEQREFEAAVGLFDERAELELSGETASGRSGIERLLTSGYRNQTASAVHEAYRANSRQQQDSITFSEDRRRAQAIWHVDVALGVPLHDNSTAAQMARLQGQLAERRWESGRLEVGYVNTESSWKIAKLEYRG
jgi:hypothetical protein